MACRYFSWVAGVPIITWSDIGRGQLQSHKTEIRIVVSLPQHMLATGNTVSRWRKNELLASVSSVEDPTEILQVILTVHTPQPCLNHHNLIIPPLLT